jgi:GNAT superfamily N-acetyltransferase
VVPEEIRELVESPLDYMPHVATIERIQGDGYLLTCGGGASVNTVDAVRRSADTLAEAVAEVRRALAARDRVWVQWMLGPSTTPPDAEERLRGLGFEPASGVPYEYRSRMLALVTEPPPPPEEIRVRRIADAPGLEAAVALQMEAFGAPDELRLREAPAFVESWRQSAEEGATETYGAWIDGELAASARASFTPRGVFLSGGSVLPAFRGRGAYRALVRARWDAAVERGTPALVTHAGKMSRPILERLGFEDVGELRVLVDQGPWE